MKDLSILPNGVQTAFESWTQDLEVTLADRLISAVIYDGIVKNEDARDTDSIRVMFVMNEMSVEILDVLRKVCRRFKLARQLQPFILTQEDLMTSTDVFPIRFLDMQQDYILLCGKDVLKDLTIKRDHLRLRCEQEIKNSMLRLRTSYFMNLDLKGGISRVMLRSYYTLLRSLDVLAELKTGKTLRKANEILSAATEMGLDITCLKRIAKLRDGDGFRGKDEEKKTYNELMSLLTRASALADQMD